MTLLRARFWLLLITLVSVTAMAQDANYRLTKKVTPIFQQINLKVDPDSPTFSGETTISIKVNEATDTIEFYQLDLNIVKAELLDSGRVIPLSVTSHEYDIQHAKAASKLKAQNYKLHIVFDGKVNTTSDGMYLAKFEGNNYLFTQFEDMHARRAFPSFDEPSFKIPFQLTITAPENQTVVANTLVQRRSVKDGWQTVEFTKTQPMPTYIVAYAIGSLDSADIPGLKVPGKIYTPKGQAGRTKFVAKHTAEILASLERYFGIDYPYDKLDLIAVPNFTHGAMENAGLVTFRSSLLLLDDEPSVTEQKYPLNVVAHELAHMWYGDLVTMAWWDDLWLNEAFASWMSTKVMLELYPEHNIQAELVQEGAFAADSSPTTKPVKKTVKSQTDVMDGLGLNYSKGESILQLIESLVGEKAFQKGIQKYMQNNAWGNAQADDLWAVLSTVADFDVPALMKTYLEQPAYPLISFETDGSISQSRYRLKGAQVKEQVWTVPLVISYKKNGKINRTQLFLKDKVGKLAELAEADWIFPNDNALAYMRWQIPAKQLASLLKDINVLNVREKKSLLYNTEALFSAGKIELSQYMAVLDVLANDLDPIVGSGVVTAFNDLVYLVDEDNKQLFAHFAQSKLLPWFTRLGITEQDNDSSDIRRLRSAVFAVLSRYTDTPEVNKISLDLTQQYLAKPGSVPRAIATAAMRNVARTGDASWFNKFKSVYVHDTDANIQSTIGSAMTFSQNENIEKTLDFALSEDVSPANVISFVARATSAKNNHDELYVWLQKNFDNLVQKMPAYHVARLPEYAATSCSQHDIEASELFFNGHKAKFDGMERSFDIALAESKQCLLLKESNQATFNAYLKNAIN
jgi:cytosol alanyl aminopeptidase